MSVRLDRFLVFFLAAVSFVSFSWAADPSAPASQQSKLKKLQEQLDRLKTMHASILDNQAEIKSELETLRIWIRRQS